MKFVADLHLHSHYSRATSKQLNLEYLSKWAQLKGITVVGTGDFIHPGWLEELRSKLEPAEDGLFKLKDEFARATQHEVPKACTGEVRFMLTAEISNIYKRLDKVRKVHNVVFAPSFEAGLKMQSRLEAIGNIRSDGRPILGLDSRDLLEIVLESDPLSFLVPAHIWTPWFSALGSKGGFDSIDDCFADLTPHVFAVETGLSSDPPMNWRLTQLDRFILISNSDAHSPPKLGREANVFDTELSYPAIRRAWQDPHDKGFVGTIEFFPEEGKYHYDGHRNCQTRLHPAETTKLNGLCPVCQKPVTVGVMARVEELADRKEGERPPRSRPYTNLIPLTEVIAEARNQTQAAKAVTQVYDHLIKSLGNELYVLQEAPLEDIRKQAGEIIAEAIHRMREGRVHIAAGYDGEYGTIQIFTAEERRALQRQYSFIPSEADGRSEQSSKSNSNDLFGQVHQDDAGNSDSGSSVVTKNLEDDRLTAEGEPRQSDVLNGAQQFLNPSQLRAVMRGDGHLLITAGPGTGKTHTLVHRIAHLVESGEDPGAMLAITFTNKAADEMRQRLQDRLSNLAKRLTIGTFHALGLSLLREFGGEMATFEIADQERVLEMGAELWPKTTAAERRRLLEVISHCRATLSEPKDSALKIEFEKYETALRLHKLWDYDGLLTECIHLLELEASVRNQVRNRIRWIFVDEYQDINPAQHRLLKLLAHKQARVTAIGDPNQAIYGFRGSDVGFFNQFSEDFPEAVEMQLEENYRSGANILSASGQVIARGEEAFSLPLSPALLTEGRVIIYAAPTDKAEAEYVVHQIERMVGGTSMFSQDSGRVERDEAGERSFGDIAILYRLNAMRPFLEEALQRSGMPYQVSGDAPLLLRKGVAALLALVRMSAGLSFNAAHLTAWFALLGSSFGLALSKKAAAFFAQLNSCHAQAMRQFASIQQLNEKQTNTYLAACDAAAAFAVDLSNTGLPQALEHFCQCELSQAIKNNDSACWENWQRMIGIARRAPSVQAFNDMIALQGEADHIEQRAEKISLMTLHASKGLEFPVVFVVGCEETLLPMNIDTLRGDPEEERRLLYVGMTRAQERLYLVRTKQRMLFGKTRQNEPSRFLADIEEQLKAYEHWKAKPRKEADKVAERQLRLF